MMTLDRYTRLLGKRQSKLFVPNKDGVLDLYYVTDLSSQFMHAQEKDVNVSECWQRDAMFDNLQQFLDLCLNRINQGFTQYEPILEQANLVMQILRDIVQMQSFVYEEDFKMQIETLCSWTMQTQDQGLISFFMPFHTNYHNLCFFASEYTSRLKAISSSVLLNLAKISINQQDLNNKKDAFSLDPATIIDMANPLVKSLLA